MLTWQQGVLFWKGKKAENVIYLSLYSFLGTSKNSTSLLMFFQNKSRIHIDFFYKGGRPSIVLNVKVVGMS